MLERMKIALRISTDYFDDEICGVITAARMELIRAGVKEEKAKQDDDELIVSAIRTYVLATYAADTKQAEGYEESFKYQLDNLRRSAGYRREEKA